MGFLGCRTLLTLWSLMLVRVGSVSSAGTEYRAGCCFARELLIPGPGRSLCVAVGNCSPSRAFSPSPIEQPWAVSGFAAQPVCLWFCEPRHVPVPPVLEGVPPTYLPASLCLLQILSQHKPVSLFTYSGLCVHLFSWKAEGEIQRDRSPVHSASQPGPGAPSACHVGSRAQVFESLPATS